MVNQRFSPFFAPDRTSAGKKKVKKERTGRQQLQEKKRT